MATTFNVIFLGVSAIDIDPTEGNTASEDMGLLVGLTFGSAEGPLYDNVQTLSPVGSPGASYDSNNNPDQFSVDGTTYRFDGWGVYNVTITYSDGTTATAVAKIAQTTTGQLYLTPDIPGQEANQALFEAKPIQALTLNATGSQGTGMTADRLVGNFMEPVDGTAGNDTMNVGYTDANGDAVTDGADIIRAGDGNDSINAGAGSDVIYGGAGSDIIDDWSGNDLVYAGDGADTVNLSTGNDTVYMEGGDDLVRVFDNAGSNTLFGGDGYDALDFRNWQSTGGAEVNIGADGSGTFSHFSGATTGTFSQFEFISGTAFHDTMNAATSNVSIALAGEGGDDVLISGAGDDVLLGDEGRDTLFAGAGSDYLDGGAGNDLVWGGAGDDYVLGGAGHDTISGESGADTMDGGAGNDQIQGGQGGDSIAGGAGDDFILGDGQWYTVSDFASVGDGAATNLTVINSADGPIDLWWIDAAGALQFFATIQSGETHVQPTFGDHNWVLRDDQGYYLELIEGAANQTVHYGAEGLADSISGGDGHDTLQGQFGDDTLDGGAGTDLIYGGTGNDSVSGGIGNDVLWGGVGNDTLLGDAGNDILFGGDGNDSLIGGAGNDTITTGEGADTIVLQNFGGSDRVTDFNLTLVNGKTVDQLDVSALTNALGAPVTWHDVVVTDTNGDGTGDAILTFPGGESITLLGVSPGQVDGVHEMAQMGIPCFVAGCPILTPSGPRAVETLVRGDLVETQNGPARVIWAGSRSLGLADLAARPDQLPIHFAAGAIGNSLPVRLSPQHAVRIFSADGAPVLIRAKHMAEAGLHGVRIARSVKSVCYHHLLLERHAVVFAAGAGVESMYPGPMALGLFSAAARLAIAAAIIGGHRASTARVINLADLSTIYGRRCLPLLGRKDALLACWGGGPLQPFAQKPKLHSPSGAPRGQTAPAKHLKASAGLCQIRQPLRAQAH